METTGIIGALQGLYRGYRGNIGDYIGIMENEMETTV